MAGDVYYPIESDTLPIPFDTFGGTNGESITMSGLAVTDIEIYKDGGTTQRASDNGYTLLDTDGIDFDGITGIHGISIDLSDNSDSGFYEVGPWYWVVLGPITIDSQTVSFVLAKFRIVSATRGLAGTALPNAAADAAGGLVISDAGGLDIDALDTQIDAIETDTQDIQSRLPAALSSNGNITADVQEINNSETAADNADSCFTGTTTTLDGVVSTMLTQFAGLNDPTAAAIATAVLTTAMTEAYASAGSAPTLAQILFEARALLAEKSVSSVTVTTKKLDGSTTAATYTLDDDTNPTSITRAT